MKNILLALFLIPLLSLSLFACTDNDIIERPDELETILWSEYASNIDPTSSNTQFPFGQVFSPTDNLRLAAISIKLNTLEEGCQGHASMSLYIWDDSNIATSEFIETSPDTINLSELVLVPGAWYTFNFSQLILEANQHYAFWVHGDDKNGDCKFWYDSGTLIQAGDYALGYNGSEWGNKCCATYIWELDLGEQGVITNEPEYGDLGSVTLSGFMPYTAWQDSYSFYIDVGTTTDYGLRYKISNPELHSIGGAHAYYWEKTFATFQYDTTYHFRASAYGNNYNAWFYGTDKTFEIDSDAQYPVLDVSVDDLGYDTKFLISLMDLGSEDSVDLFVKYSTTLDGLMTAPQSITAPAGVTTEGAYSATDTTGAFTSSTVYYYRAMADGTTLDSYSEVHKFLKSDPDKGPAQNKWENWWTNAWGGSLDTLYWLLLFGLVLSCIVMSIAFKSKWIFIIGALVSIGLICALYPSLLWIFAVMAMFSGIFWGLKLVRGRR